LPPFSLKRLSGVSVGNTLSIGGPEIKKLFLGGGSVGYELVVEDSTLGEDIDIADVTVGHNFSFAGNKCLGNVDLHRVNIGSDLIVGETHFFKNLDLTGTRIGGRLSIKSSRWEKDSMLNLTNANVQWIEDDQSHWPYHLYLDGFSYTMWTAWQPDRAAKVRGATADRKISWFETWLKKQNNYSPGPYNQLAGVFRNAGRLDEANCILYASKERERSVSNGFNKIFLWLSMILTGYGYHYERSVVWCLVFVVLGTVILRCSGESRKHQVELGFFYSLDAFLPFVQLRKRFADVDFSGWIKYYFYAHRLAGYIIGSFILAALSGIAK
jgi:hypothetical protein